MNRSIVVAGVVIGLLVTAWALVMGLTGWAFDPATAPRFALVVVLQLVVLGALLRATAVENGLVAQVRTGTLASAVATPIVFAQSLAFTLLWFPEPVAAQPENGGPLAQALAGVLGTLGTGLVGSMLLGAVLRKRGAPASER
ncbi:MAG: hypothetical protein U0234_26095 [Sandaracinus sp.]